ncbi:DEAD/DEAH box helicase family protein [archaeon]|nr:DEAD/DEAH box helicase family protein [Nanoarchaeota archaeon]MBU4300121.1 DEAD/DEAH box helicase family protein [Nanoarchaeota archaeon]MBU4451765.1 DEAD/DEAH box helicase family protein [Nanoarchaeota archaeon]MCG2724327.1 DEAD/DEAH box helicase family protein [archaeon]
MNEDETRAELIDPKLKESGWGVIEGTKINRNFPITLGRIKTGNLRASPIRADYILSYKGRKLAVIEAKSDVQELGEGVAQAKEYALKLHLETTFATNGKEIYQICMETGKEGIIKEFPTPDELWNKTFNIKNNWKEKFNAIPKGGIYEPRFYQEIATNNALDAIAEGKNRLLLTLATGTGKTTIAFQIAWKLFHARWNLLRDGARRPRILFLTDRNILANQAFNEFSAFPEDALIRITPKDIRKKGSVPKNGSIFFTIFQTFMSGPNDTPYFGQYPKDYFDLIIIDECHRGGANDEGNWRAIMEYFSPAVQLGLTATPKRKENADTYKYFGKPLYVYSLKEGINDGFLTPFKVRTIKTTLDEYVYTSDDEVIEGEVEAGKIYQGADWNRIIEIKEKEAHNVKLLLKEINQNEKAIVFCASQDHALAIRDLINQYKKSKEPNYCVRVTANDGRLGDEYLAEFRDNEKTIPTILTTSQKLSTGVDARNIRNIVLMRQIKEIIEFKQIVGRGTRLFDGKEFFTIYDFVGACQHFSDPEWDGEPMEPELSTGKNLQVIKEATAPYNEDSEDQPKKNILKIRLGDGKEREIQHMVKTSFWSANGKPISLEEFLKTIYGELPNFFKNEDELRKIWSNPITRKALLDKLDDAGYGMTELKTLQQLINAENSDIFDVLEYISFAIKPISREERVAKAQSNILKSLDNNQREFLEFVLSKYIETGIEELDQDKLPDLLKIKYFAINDATELLGGVTKIRATFINFQKHLFATASD